MSCDVGEVTKWLENEQLFSHSLEHVLVNIVAMGGSPGDVSEEPVTQEKQKKGWRMSCNVGKQQKDWKMSCDVGKTTEGLKNEL